MTWQESDLSGRWAVKLGCGRIVGGILMLFMSGSLDSLTEFSSQCNFPSSSRGARTSPLLSENLFEYSSSSFKATSGSRQCLFWLLIPSSASKCASLAAFWCSFALTLGSFWTLLDKGHVCGKGLCKHPTADLLLFLDSRSIDERSFWLPCFVIETELTVPSTNGQFLEHVLNLPCSYRNKKECEITQFCGHFRCWAVSRWEGARCLNQIGYKRLASLHCSLVVDLKNDYWGMRLTFSELSGVTVLEVGVIKAKMLFCLHFFWERT